MVIETNKALLQGPAHTYLRGAHVSQFSVDVWEQLSTWCFREPPHSVSLPPARFKGLYSTLCVQGQVEEQSAWRVTPGEFAC